jgi:hypothetical protein
MESVAVPAQSDAEGEDDAVWDAQPELVAERGGERDTEGVFVTERLRVPEPLLDGVTVEEPLCVRVRAALGDAVPLPLPLGEPDSVPLTPAEGEGETEGLPDSEGLTLTDHESEGEPEGVLEGRGEADCELDARAEGDAEVVALTETHADSVRDTEVDGELERVRVGDTVLVEPAVPEEEVKVVRLERHRPMQVVGPALFILTGNREDQVQVTRGEAGGFDKLPRFHDLLRRVTAAERIERGVVEALHAHRDARDADLLERGELVGPHRRRCEFDRPFGRAASCLGHGLAESQ